jgi:cell division protein FtsB
LLSVLLISAVGIFVTGLMKYDELQREKETLEKQKEALELEIEELQYLIDCPVDYDYIIRVAREKLGLHLPDEIIYYTDQNK